MDILQNKSKNLKTAPRPQIISYNQWEEVYFKTLKFLLKHDGRVKYSQKITGQILQEYFLIIYTKERLFDWQGVWKVVRSKIFPGSNLKRLINRQAIEQSEQKNYLNTFVAEEEDILKDEKYVTDSKEKYERYKHKFSLLYGQDAKNDSKKKIFDSLLKKIKPKHAILVVAVILVSTTAFTFGIYSFVSSGQSKANVENKSEKKEESTSVNKPELEEKGPVIVSNFEGCKDEGGKISGVFKEKCLIGGKLYTRDLSEGEKNTFNGEEAPEVVEEEPKQEEEKRSQEEEVVTEQPVEDVPSELPQAPDNQEVDSKYQSWQEYNDGFGVTFRYPSNYQVKPNSQLNDALILEGASGKIFVNRQQSAAGLEEIVSQFTLGLQVQESVDIRNSVHNSKKVTILNAQGVLEIYYFIKKEGYIYYIAGRQDGDPEALEGVFQTFR
jgi:hypothetical protein